MQEIKFINRADTDSNESYNRYEPIMGNNYIVIDWQLSNVCNYSCTYCHPDVYDGTRPWPELDTAIKFMKLTTDHYRSIGKSKIVWNLLGGEPTVWKNFSKFFNSVKDYDPGCNVRILTNGSRTLNWWKRNANLFDEVIVSWHPERADYVHCTDVLNILYDAGVITSVQVCMYPPLEELCLEAAKYFYENSKCFNVSPKSLQETILDDRTFVYSEEFLKEIKQYQGQPKFLNPELRNSHEFEHELNKFKQSRNTYGKMMRFINTHTGKTEFIQANDTMAQGRNSWKGWMCNIGIETLTVNEFGRVSSGSSCFTKLSHGYISDPDKIEFPIAGRICEFEWCSCIADVETTKYRIE